MGKWQCWIAGFQSTDLCTWYTKGGNDACEKIPLSFQFEITLIGEGVASCSRQQAVLFREGCFCLYSVTLSQSAIKSFCQTGTQSLHLPLDVVHLPLARGEDNWFIFLWRPIWKKSAIIAAIAREWELSAQRCDWKQDKFVLFWSWFKNTVSASCAVSQWGGVGDSSHPAWVPILSKNWMDWINPWLMKA